MDDDNLHGWDWFSVLLFLILLMTAVFRLSAAHWTEDLDRVRLLTLFGGLIGLAVGRSRFSAKKSILLGAGYGISLIFVAFISTYGSDTPTLEAASLVLARIQIAFRTFTSGRAVYDPILFQVGISLVFWGIGSEGGYLLIRRGTPWFPFILPAIAISVIDHYNQRLPDRGIYFVIALLVGLMLVFRLQFIRARSDWQTRKIYSPPDHLFNLTRNVLCLLLVVVILGWNIPTLSEAFSPASSLWTEISRPFQKLRTQLSNALIPLKGGESSSGIYDAATLNLGLNANLGSRLLFTVKASEPARSDVPYYWRVRVYDRYEDSYWRSTAQDEVPLMPDTAFPILRYENQKEVEFTFNLAEPSSEFLYAAAYAWKIDRKILFISGPADDGQVDGIGLKVETPLPRGSIYRIVSLIQQPAADDLRESGKVYPVWVGGRYLQLPDSFPQRVRTLTRDLTAGMDNPYQKVQAVTNYLRKNIRYNPSIDPPPARMDPIEWFLFEKKEGFCNYYASAEVLMLRSIGIPARLVAGYRQGELNILTDQYTIREKNLHAWPEVYFSGIGWVEFEPTTPFPAVNIPEAARNVAEVTRSVETPSGRIVVPLSERPERPAASTYNPVSDELRSLWQAFLLLLFLVSAVFLVRFWWTRQRTIHNYPPFPAYLEQNIQRRGWAAPQFLHRWSLYSQLSGYQKAYYWTDQSFRLLGSPPKSSLTIQERVGEWVDDLPACAETARPLVAEMEKSLFSQHLGNLSWVQQTCGQIRSQIFREAGRRLIQIRK
jgi:transglutaminase-like putative cysteine protease